MEELFTILQEKGKVRMYVYTSYLTTRSAGAMRTPAKAAAAVAAWEDFLVLSLRLALSLVLHLPSQGGRTKKSESKNARGEAGKTKQQAQRQPSKTKKIVTETRQ